MNEKDLIGKTIEEIDLDGLGIKITFTDGTILTYWSSDGGYSLWDIVGGEKKAPTIGGWISVEDKLPETEYDYFGHSTGESHDVLIYMENENYSESRILVGKYSMLFSYWPQEDRANGWRVTHWMPLPEPPEAKHE